jgi:L-2-hydroxyglutarate oxidase LhgO
MEKVDITIIGAGVIGLAVSASVSGQGRSVYVLEKNSSFGRETSSRNSEVLHAGIYYPPNSLKAKTCVEGNRLIYDICERENIACRRIGKLIVACEKDEVKEIEHLFQNGRRNGVLGLRILSEREIKAMEPNVRACAALYSPNTGIVDSHNLMRSLYLKAKAKGAEFVFHTEARQIEKQKEGYQVTVRDADGTDFSFFTRLLINCAGLNSDLIAQLTGIDIEKAGYTLNLCKGQYFRVGTGKSNLVKHLIYPVPGEKDISLGIHAVFDLAGALRFGPDVQYIDRSEINYDVNNAKREEFHYSINRYLPFIEKDDLIADTSGIRAALQGQKDL